ncbi:MAG: hypothetical protein Q7J78_02595 [Clostridiales bacterium]|nr:hypothetical protein [Clostridiales bacterium]
MKGKRKLFAILLIVLLILIIVIVGILTCKSKEKANLVDITPPSTTPTTTSPTLSLTPSTTPTMISPTPSLTPSTTPTTTSTMSTLAPPPSAFQGSLTGKWSGQIADTTPVNISGTFLVTIDANGGIQGSFNGTYSGIIAGQVDLNGNLAATGTASRDTTTDVTSWQGKLSVSGNSLSTQGDLSGQNMSGIFSGTGIASH